MLHQKMIRVVIVEDDKLARLGIISSISWENYGMTIIFDTGNPQKALEYMEEHGADLLLTDLSMPVMSGLDLVKKARKFLTSLQFAVLTMHQNFDYIQESLRLGALDYICKSQFEQDDVAKIIGKIRERYDTVSHALPSPGSFQRKGACYIVLYPCSTVSPFHTLSITLSVVEKTLHEHACLYYLDDTSISIRTKWEDALSLPPSDVMTVKLEDADYFTDETLQSVPPFDRQAYFYTFREGYSIQNIAELMSDNVTTTYEYYADTKQDFLSLKWIFNRNQFQSIMDSFRSNRIPYVKLISLFSRVETEINNCYGFLFQQSTFVMPDFFPTLYHASKWFETTADKIRQAIEWQSCSPYLIECLSQALLIIHTEYDRPLLSDDLARRVHLSRSYFCQLFKKMTHQSFNRYLRNVRLSKAKELLVRTSLPISEVAEKTGYPDEKYFSKLFHSETGMTPSIYRQNSRE